MLFLATLRIYLMDLFFFSFGVVAYNATSKAVKSVKNNVRVRLLTFGWVVCVCITIDATSAAALKFQHLIKILDDITAQ